MIRMAGQENGRRRLPGEVHVQSWFIFMSRQPPSPGKILGGSECKQLLYPV